MNRAKPHWWSPAGALAIHPRFIAAIYAVITLAVTLHKCWRGQTNNLRIFRASFFNLVAGRDLYALHPSQHLDHFKYSPTFALLIAPFAVIPEWASAVAWNFCNVFALFAAINGLKLSTEQKAVILWLILVELVISVQNFQSNALVAALVIGTFVAFELRSPETAGLLVALSASIKIFGLAAALFSLFYRGKLRFILATLAALAVLLALPLAVNSLDQLNFQYQSWIHLLQSDYLAKEKLSVMNWLHAWFGVNWGNTGVQLVGGCLLLLPLFRVSAYAQSAFRYHFLASALIFLVIFNHKAESPMFILAITGVVLWYSTSERAPWRTAVTVLTIGITSLGSTDLVPRHLREGFMTPLVLKAVPCIAVWIIIQAELLLYRRKGAIAIK